MMEGHSRIYLAKHKILILILLLALATRLIGISFGLPYIYHVDEARFAKISLDYFTGDLNPHFFHVPTLHTYMVSGIWAIYFHTGKVFGVFHSATDFLNSFYEDPSLLVIMGRLLTVLLSVGTIFLVFWIGKKMYNYRVGTIASLFLIFSHVHNKISHYQVPDAPMIFFFMLSFLLIWHIYEKGDTKYYVLAGLCAGLAMATKYGGQLLFLPLLLAHVFRTLDNKRPIKSIFLSVPLYLTGIFFVLGFFLGCPYCFLDFPTFWQGFSWQSQHLYVAGHFGSSTATPAWLFYLKHGFRENIGLLSQFLVLGGVVYGLIKHRKKDILLLSIPLVLFVIVGGWKAMAVRYLLPLTPFFILIASVFLDDMLSKMESGWARSQVPILTRLGNKRRLAVLVLLIFILPSAYKVLRFDLSLTQTDTRTVARDWIEENIPTGSYMAKEMYGPPISEEKYDVHYRHTLGQVAIEYLANRNVEFVAISDIMYSRFLNAPEEFPRQSKFYQSLDEHAVLIKTIEPKWNESLIDLHNPTIKIYRISSYPNLFFPGNFAQYSQKIVLTRASRNRWRVESSVIPKASIGGIEKVKNPYIRIIDAEGTEVAKLVVFEGDITNGDGTPFENSTRFTHPPAELSLCVGYEYILDPKPSSFTIESLLKKEFVIPEKIKTSDFKLNKLQYLFLYTESPNSGQNKYFQTTILSNRAESWRLESHVYGNILRWGESYVENPSVLITDTEGEEIATLRIHEGKVGQQTDKRGQARRSQSLPPLPEIFRVYAVFTDFFDGQQPGFSGEPAKIEIEIPSLSRD
jgi:4-amino-4-deoxy-L-arabinose transferase-like glycosyltransferase